jgi:hypothetical protein
MPTPVVDLGNPLANFFNAFWKSVGEDLRGEAPIFGAVPSKYRGLPASERATIEKEAARQNAEAFVNGPHFIEWVKMTAEFVDEDLDPAEFRRALYGSN